MPMNKIIIDEIFEKKKDDKANRTITNMENLNTSISSIFFPIQIKIKLLAKVADVYIEPNCPWLICSSFLMLGLKIPIKKLCPKQEKNVNMNPNIITFKLKFLYIYLYVL